MIMHDLECVRAARPSHFSARRCICAWQNMFIKWWRHMTSIIINCHIMLVEPVKLELGKFGPKAKNWEPKQAQAQNYFLFVCGLNRQGPSCYSIDTVKVHRVWRQGLRKDHQIRSLHRFPEYQSQTINWKRVRNKNGNNVKVLFNFY